MGKFLVKIGKKLIEFNKYLKGKWNSLMYALMFKNYNEKCNCEDNCICKRIGIDKNGHHTQNSCNQEGLSL